MPIQRVIYPTKFEIRAGDDGQEVLAGYAAPFNQLSVMLWGFRERIRPGAFSGSLNGDVRALWQHDSAAVLGRTRAGTLRLSEDDVGLAFELEPPDTQIGRDAMTLIRRGDVDQMSFGFNVLPDGSEWSESDDGVLIRTLTNVTLMEISPVTWAAYPQTSVNVRSDNFIDELDPPDWVRRALLQSDDDSAEQEARARLEMMRRRLRIAEHQ